MSNRRKLRQGGPVPVDGHVDMSTADLCRHPSGCRKRWAVEIKMKDGWATFMCDEHWGEFAVDDPVHGGVASVTGMW